MAISRGRVPALSDERAPHIVRVEVPIFADETDEAVTLLRLDVREPAPDICGRLGVEERRVRDADVVPVPRVTLDQKLRHFLHFLELKQPASPIRRRRPTEVPRDFP